MSHIVHPYAHRLGIIRDWKSRWFPADRSRYREYLRCDTLLREFLEKRLRGMYVSAIEMERGQNNLRVIMKTSRPGMIIGRSGEGMARIREDIRKFFRQKKISEGVENMKIDIEEVRSPESNAKIVAYMVAEGIEKRMPFRRVLKQTLEKVMANRDTAGVRVKLSGRLGGADMARREELRRGRIPLQTFRADIDFARVRATIPQGDIGIKVWIYKGEVFSGKQGVERV